MNPAVPRERVAAATWKLLRLRWRISFNSFRHARRGAKIGTIAGLVVSVALGGFAFWASWMLLSFLRSPQLRLYIGDTSPLIRAVPALVFSGLFLGILLTSFGVLLQALYLSGDMDFLLSAPLPVRAVFITKLLQAVLPNFGMIMLFGLPVLYGLGAAQGYNLLYYPLVLLMMATLSLAAAGLAALAVMLVVRIFPARRVVEVLGFCGAILSLICSQSGNLMNYSRQEMDVSRDQISSALLLVERLNNPWLPINWPGQGLAALGEGRWLPGVGLTLFSLLAAGGAFWVALGMAERWYYTGWAGMQTIAQRKKAARPAHTERAPAQANAISRLLPAAVRGMIWKDYLVLRRDLRQLSQLITPLIFGVIYGLMFLRSGGEPPAGRGEAPAWFMDSLRTVFAYGNIGLALLVGWMLLQRLAGMGFSQEGKNYWMLKTAPVSVRQMLSAKFLVAYLPSLALSEVFLLAFSLLQKVSLADAAYSILALALCLLGMAGIQLACGAAGANFTWEDPRRMNAGSWGCLGTLLMVIYVPLNLGLFLGPLFVTALLNLPVGYAYLAGGVLGAGMSLACALLPPLLLERRVEHLGEA